VSTYTQRRENAYAIYRDAHPMTADEIDDRQVDAIDFAHQTLDEFVKQDPVLETLRVDFPPRMDGR
jgi:hypothetical protein